MKAVTFHQHGGPEELRYEEVPDPTIGPGEVLVRVKACALNHLDIWIRQGIPSYQLPLPHISGCDVSGVVEQIADADSGLVVGQSIFVSPGLSCWRCRFCLSGRDNFCPEFKILGAQVDGGYAEFVKVPVRNILPLPEGLTFEQAAAFPLVSVTAWHMIVELANLRPGEMVLVMGAGSGVGSIAVQLANLMGARVVTTVGAEEKMEKAKNLGAEFVVNHTNQDWVTRVKEFTNGQGVDVVIEHIGEKVWKACLKVLARGGRLVTCGTTTGGELNIDGRFLFSRQLTIKGSYMGMRSELNQATELVGLGKLKPVIDRVFPLAEARAAQEVLVSRRIFGKVVLTPG